MKDGVQDFMRIVGAKLFGIWNQLWYYLHYLCIWYNKYLFGEVFLIFGSQIKPHHMGIQILISFKKQNIENTTCPELNLAYFKSAPF